MADTDIRQMVDLLRTAQDACFIPEAFALVVCAGGYLFGHNDVGLASLLTLLSVLVMHALLWALAFALWQFLPDEEGVK